MALNLVPGSAPFPPSETPCLQKTIPAYPYKEYDDDDDLQAMFYAYNVLVQIYIDWFNQINLPIYTGLSGALLDWVAQGLYGRTRPTLYSNTPDAIGPINTYSINGEGIDNGALINKISNMALTNDDIFKRIITWHFFKGDGKQISVPWVRRRVARFLYGAGGSDFPGPVRNVSVIIGPGSCQITIINSLVRVAASAGLNRSTINSMTINSGTLTITPFAVPATAPIFLEAVNSGALETPAQLNVTCRIGAIGVAR